MCYNVVWVEVRNICNVLLIIFLGKRTFSILQNFYLVT